MTNKPSLGQIAVLAGYAIGMAGGQLLFKRATLQLPGEVPLANRLFSLLHNGFFLGAVALPVVLTFTPLSRAYPFVAIAFALTPVLGALVFAEPHSIPLLIGLAAIMADFTSSPGERT